MNTFTNSHFQINKKIKLPIAMAATMMMQKLPSFHQFSQILHKPKTHFGFVQKSTNQSQSNEIFTLRDSDNGISLRPNCVEEINVHRKERRLIQEFDPRIPIEEAWTPPSSWYTDPNFYALELDQVFYKGWHPVGYTDQIRDPHDFFTGSLGSIDYVVCRDEKGMLNAFHNVCQHHASLLALGTGKKSCFVCPYHGWTYGLNGALIKATRITGIKNFKVNEMGLVPLKVAVWGPFVLINFNGGMRHGEEVDTQAVANEWLGSTAEILSKNGVDTSLDYICRRTFTIECNWKVFCDNYLDGGYHVPYAHKGLASGLRLDSYSTKMFEKVSIQSCEGGASDNEEFVRIGSEALYAFVYPNFMINRYGPWMDTNLVLPLGPRRCKVVFDYFLEGSLKGDSAFIEKSLEDSKRVQLEDITLSEAVQRGLESPAYNVGRYSPSVEMAMHHFHCLLHENLWK